MDVIRHPLQCEHCGVQRRCDRSRKKSAHTHAGQRMSDILKAMKSIHHILSSNTVEMNIKEARCECPVWKVIVDMCSLLRRPRADFKNVLALDGHYRVRHDARRSHQHFCCNSLH